MAALLTMVSLEEQPLVNSFNKVFLGAAGTSTGESDDQFNRVSFLSHFEGANNGDNNAFDDGSTSNHTVTAAGNVTQGSFGPFARPDGEFGVDFDGNDHLNVAETNADEFTFGTGNFTVEGWINNKALDGSRCFISTAQGTDQQGFWFGIHGGKYYLIYNDGENWSVIVNAGTPVANVWTHFAVVRNGTSNVVYINGSSVGSTTETARDLTNTNNLIAIGGRSSVGQYTISTMSNVRVVKGTAVYTGNFTPSTSKLTAITNTKLLTCQSNNFIDNSASPLTITSVGNPAVSAFGPFLTSEIYSAATNGASAYFDGSGDYLITANTSNDFNLGTGQFTFECWAYLTSSAQQTIIGSGISGSSSMFNIFLYQNVLQVHSPSEVLLGNAGALQINAWQHIVVERDGSNNLKAFINGTQTATTSTTADFAANNTFKIGTHFNGGNPFVGYISDVRFIKGAGVEPQAGGPTAPLPAITNTKLLLNMADGQAIDSAAQTNLTLYGNANTSTDQAKFGNTSLHLDGTGDYVNVFPASRGLIYNWTIEQWIYPTRGYAANGQQFDRIWGNGQVLNASVQLHFDDTTAPKIVLRLNDNVIWTSSVSISLNAWTHVAAVCDANGTRLYIAGTERATTSTVVNLAAKNFNIGTSITTNGFFQGFMDDFRISDFARYTGNFTAPDAAFEDKGK